MNNLFISKIRTLKNIDRQETAGLLSMDITNYINLENGNRPVSNATATKLSEAFHCSRDWFLRAPVIVSASDIIYYLKSLYAKDASIFTIKYTKNGPVLIFNDLDFLDLWKEKKVALAEKKITEQEYYDWFFSYPGTGRETNNRLSKLKILRKQKEISNPGFANKITDCLEKSFTYYQMIEDGTKQPTALDLKRISRAFDRTPEFLSDNFTFESKADIELFLMTVDVLYEKIAVSYEKSILFQIPQVNLFLENLALLNEKYQSGKISKSQYETEWQAL